VAVELVVAAGQVATVQYSLSLSDHFVLEDCVRSTRMVVRERLKGLHREIMREAPLL
jgi:hypothetical protein